jgi:hypothetical protein
VGHQIPGALTHKYRGQASEDYVAGCRVIVDFCQDGETVARPNNIINAASVLDHRFFHRERMLFELVPHGYGKLPRSASWLSQRVSTYALRLILSTIPLYHYHISILSNHLDEFVAQVYSHDG